MGVGITLSVILVVLTIGMIVFSMVEIGYRLDEWSTAIACSVAITVVAVFGVGILSYSQSAEMTSSEEHVIESCTESEPAWEYQIQGEKGYMVSWDGWSGRIDGPIVFRDGKGKVKIEHYETRATIFFGAVNVDPVCNKEYDVVELHI